MASALGSYAASLPPYYWFVETLHPSDGTCSEAPLKTKDHLSEHQRKSYQYMCPRSRLAFLL